MIELDGEDLHRTPIERRKVALAKLLGRAPPPGIVLNAHYKAEGAIVYREACALGCEGIVSKRLGSSYRSGRADCWVKSRTPTRQRCGATIAEEFWVLRFGQTVKGSFGFAASSIRRRNAAWAILGDWIYRSRTRASAL